MTDLEKEKYNAMSTKEIARKLLSYGKLLSSNSDIKLSQEEIKDIHEKMTYLFKLSNTKHEEKHKHFVEKTGIDLFNG